MSVAGRRLARLSCAVLCSVGGLTAGDATSAAAQQVFRAAVDLIAVDVRVVGRDGLPVMALGPEKFDVTIDGRRRRVVSATLTQDLPVPQDAGPRPLITPLDGQALSGGSALAGRTFIIAVDTSSFRSLDVRVATAAAEHFTRQVRAEDRVGLIVLPDGPRLPPTTSHARVRQLLATVVGRQGGAAQFEMSVEEVIDITAAMSNQSQIQSRRTVGEILTGGSTGLGDASDGLECSGPATACTEQAMGEAVNVAMSLERDVVQGISGLDSLLRELQETPDRKTVLFLSGGMPVSDRSGGRPSLGDEVKRLGERAAYANATINAIYFDPSIANAFSVGARRNGTGSGRLRNIYTRALAEFSEPSGGILLTASTGYGAVEVDRILASTATYYVLGVEPDAQDRDGRPHRLRVSVDGRDVSVTSRQLVIVPRLVR